MTKKHETPPCPTWDELRRIVRTAKDDRNALCRYIMQWPKSLRKAAAFALSVAHWSPESLRDYDDAGRSKSEPGGIYPDGEFLTRCQDCGLCALYFDATNDAEHYCARCPLFKAGYGCLEDEDHTLYRRVTSARDAGKHFKAAARKMFTVLNDLYRIEWEKL